MSLKYHHKWPNTRDMQRREPEEEQAMWSHRQRLQWCGHKERNVDSPRSWKRQGIISLLEPGKFCLPGFQSLSLQNGEGINFCGLKTFSGFSVTEVPGKKYTYKRMFFSRKGVNTWSAQNSMTKSQNNYVKWRKPGNKD